jgi:hypothetical protein
MNKLKLAFVISAVCFLYFASSATPAFATLYGNNNDWFTPNSSACAAGVINVIEQPSQQFNEITADNENGFYSMQLNIRTPDNVPGTSKQIGFQQTLGVRDGLK